ncbi:DUF2312 domain-containing protein [Salipiger mucosus]|uniref:GapR-like DNA-binding domain-containing protein n=1 Tax=Salipiger mucosus DSM 16094 TaxID=1123237 RepID=S9QRI3_9RHOB|nr:GapR family DNA-binding domain-containing protein [Salipiger mucosus]EPX84001.1 hypothetical protein Salmuc_01776 [Salipiger mucosus DSM 16094]
MSEEEPSVEGAERLGSFIERIETLEEEKSEFTEQIKEVKEEAKAQGFEPKVITAVLKIRKQPPGEQEEFNTLLDTYLTALGMETPERMGDVGELEGGESELSGFIQRLENLEEEKKEVAEQVKEVKAEAKGEGFDPKILNALLKIRKQGPAEATEFEMKVETYLAAVGTS